MEYQYPFFKEGAYLPAGLSQVSVTATNASAGSWTEVETLATNLVTNPSMEAVI